MNHIHPIHRVASILAGLAAGLLALATASPAAFARPWPHSVGPTGRNMHPPLHAPIHPVATSALTGWQITLIAAAAAVLAATVAIYRIRATRQRATTSTT